MAVRSASVVALLVVVVGEHGCRWAPAVHVGKRTEMQGRPDSWASSEEAGHGKGLGGGGLFVRWVSEFHEL